MLDRIVHRRTARRRTQSKWSQVDQLAMSTRNRVMGLRCRLRDGELVGIVPEDELHAEEVAN